MLSTRMTLGVCPVISSLKPYLPQQNTSHSSTEYGYRTGLFVILEFWGTKDLNLDGLLLENKAKQDAFVTTLVAQLDFVK